MVQVNKRKKKNKKPQQK